MLDIDAVGARPTQLGDGQWQVRLGVYLPGITYPGGYRVKARVIHERDQFIHDILPRDFDLWWRGGPLDLWDLTVDLGGGPGHFGEAGRYLYRYQLLRGDQVVTLWFADPFGHEAGTGNLSAFRAEPDAGFAWTDQAFRPPGVDRMVVYELHVGEFNATFDGVADQLDYLHALGVNVIELMPVTQVKEEVEWGYTPLGFFAPADRYGGPQSLKRLVDAAHAKGIAVILDSVYAHAHPEYPYNLVYEAAGEPNPMMGPFMGEFFGQSGTDFTKAFTRDYFLEVNRHWLEQYHIDGFRYDYVPGYYDGPTGVGYASLVYDTWRLSQGIDRFRAADGTSLLIQCAEHLPDSRGILAQTYSNTCWQNGLMDCSVAAAWGGSLADLAHQLDPHFLGYPAQYRNPLTGDTMPVAPFQYLESHDHSRFISRIAPGSGRERDLLGEAFGDRERFYRMQPFVIALYTAKGVPMLWHGQEFGENWSVPSAGIGRNLFGRPLHWEYFYDAAGKALVRLHRIMGQLRRELRCLDSRGPFYYFDDEAHRAHCVIAFRRWALPTVGSTGDEVLVILNFGDQEAQIDILFPRAGRWNEQIDGALAPLPRVDVSQENERHAVRVRSSYGAAYLLSV